MKWFRFWSKSKADGNFEDYFEIPDEVAESKKLLEIEFNAWRAKFAGHSKNVGHEAIRRPPVPWLLDKAGSLKKEADLLIERMKLYKQLAGDKGGRREETAVMWLAGSLFAEQKREKPDRRKGKKA